MGEEEKTDPLDEFERIFASMGDDVSNGVGSGQMQSRMSESLEDLRSAVAGLKSDLARSIAAQSKAEAETDVISKAAGSAVINMRTVLAIYHLQRHANDALSRDPVPRIVGVLLDGIRDIEAAEEKLDRIPF